MSRLLTSLIAAFVLFGLVIGYNLLASNPYLYTLPMFPSYAAVSAAVTAQQNDELTARVAELENTVAELTTRLEEVEAALGLSPDNSSSKEAIQESASSDLPTARSNANIRNGPGVDYAVLRTVWAGTELKIVGFNNDSGRIWYLLEDGGWIAESLIDNAPVDIEFVQAPTEPSSGDWIAYRNDKAGFAALVPANYVAVEHEQERGNPSRAVSFAAEGDDAGPDNIVISVISLPAVDVPQQQFSVTELKRIAREWIENNNVSIITGPDEMQFGDYSAVSVVNDALLTDGSMTIRGYAAFISTPNAFYYIEVAGFSEYDTLLSSTFDEFVRHFEPLVQLQ